jgi:hypothetical protein
MQVISHDGVDVVLILELACPAVNEAAAIVEAEWIRLVRRSGAVRHVTRELPAARRCRPLTRTTTTTQPRHRLLSGSARGQGPHWSPRQVRARQRSPPNRG